MRRLASILILAAGIVVGGSPRTPVLGSPGATSIAAVRPADLRAWEATVDSMSRSGSLEPRGTQSDALMQTRHHRHYAQFYRGVPVFGSFDNPATFGDPDHYSKRVLGPEDNGGVHTNCTIVDHAFYLAIEGGTNRTSGLSVQGVGAANREQIEKAFYRGFTLMLTPTATFSMARAATIQSARDLYGVGSAADRAVTQAWTAVGVN